MPDYTSHNVSGNTFTHIAWLKARVVTPLWQFIGHDVPCQLPQDISEYIIQHWDETLVENVCSEFDRMKSIIQ